MLTKDEANKIYNKHKDSKIKLIIETIIDKFGDTMLKFSQTHQLKKCLHKIKKQSKKGRFYYEYEHWNTNNDFVYDKLTTLGYKVTKRDYRLIIYWN